MIKVFTAGGRDASRLGGSWAGLVAILVFCSSLQGYVGYARAQGQKPPAKVPTPPAQPQTPPAKAQTPPAESDDDEAAPGKAGDEAKPAVDPSETQKGVAVELFLDPNAKDLLDLKKFTEIRVSKEATPDEFNRFKQMPADPLVPVDPRIITSVVDTMIAKLTNHKNIEATLDVAGGAPKAAASRAIQEATQALLEPIFLARNAKNAQFQAQYNRILALRLAPVLKNHLIPRIQAMIVLGQSGNADAYKIFLDEIKNPTQTVWVKHWAFKGLTNIKQLTNKLNNAQEIEAAKTVADQLVKNQEWPWPVQLRALETLAAFRQGFTTNSPRTADMAAAAFRYLTNGELDLEVRAEAALALGFMQITTVVPKYNTLVVAHAAAQLAAEIGDRIADGFSENKLRAQKFTTILMGPILQAFEGRAGFRESGILNSPTTSNKGDVQKYVDAIRPVVKSAVDLVGGPMGQAKARTDDLKAKVAALKAFLEKNPPANRELFQGGPQLPAPGADVAAAEAEPEKDKAKPAAEEDEEKAPEKAVEKPKSTRKQANAGKGSGKR